MVIGDDALRLLRMHMRAGKLVVHSSVARHRRRGEAHAADLHILRKLRVIIVQVIGGEDADHIGLSRRQAPEDPGVISAPARQASAEGEGMLPRPCRAAVVSFISVGGLFPDGQRTLIFIIYKPPLIARLITGAGRVQHKIHPVLLPVLLGRNAQPSCGHRLRAGRQRRVGILHVHAHFDLRQGRQTVRIGHRLHPGLRHRFAGMGIAPVPALLSHLVMLVMPWVARLRSVQVALPCISVRAHVILRVLLPGCAPEDLLLPIEGVPVPVKEFQPVPVLRIRREHVLGAQRLIILPAGPFIIGQHAAGE